MFRLIKCDYFFLIFFNLLKHRKTYFQNEKWSSTEKQFNWSLTVYKGKLYILNS
jgi:hypothetical protein